MANRTGRKFSAKIRKYDYFSPLNRPINLCNHHQFIEYYYRGVIDENGTYYKE